MSRLPPATRESVPEKYRDLFDEVAKERGGVSTGGPGSVTLNSPEVAKRTNHLSAYLRQGSGLPAKIQELAMLTTARELDCQYIWNAHAASGRREGLSDTLVDALMDNQPLPSLAADEAAAINLGQEFFKTHRVSQATFQAALDQFGRQGFAELTALMGYYAMLSFNANAVELDLPAGMTEPALKI